MLGNMWYMDIAEIYRCGKGYINEKYTLAKRCIVMLKAAVSVCICMLAVSVVLFLQFGSLLLSALLYFSVCILVLTDYVAYRFTYKGEFNRGHPIAVAGRTATGILSFVFMLWLPLAADGIRRIFFVGAGSQDEVQVYSPGFVINALIVMSTMLIVTFAWSVSLFVYVRKYDVKLEFDRGIDNFLDIFVICFRDGRVLRVDLDRYAVKILDTRYIHYQDVRICDIKNAKSDAKIISKEEISCIQNCSHILIFDSRLDRWVRTQW